MSRHQAPELNNYSSEPASLATSSSQLEAQIAVENTITIPASQEQTKYSSQDTTEDSQEDETPEETPSDSELGETAAGTTEDNVPDSSDSSDTPTVYYDDVADPEPAAGDISYVSAPLPTYSSSLQEKSFVYDDADPEPAGYYSEYVSDHNYLNKFLVEWQMKICFFTRWGPV